MHLPLVFISTLPLLPHHTHQRSHKSVIYHLRPVPARRAYICPSATTSPEQNPEKPPQAQTRLPKPGSVLFRDPLQTLTSLFPLWILVSAMLAFLRPATFAFFPTSLIPPTLSFIMLGMGLTIPPAAFLRVLRTPSQILIGVLAQYSIMPFLATAFARLSGMPPALAAGVILVGVCPGGAASNIVCLLAGADVPYSVVLTLCSTLVAIFAIPGLMYLLAGTLVPVSPAALFLTTAQLVLLPLLAGLLLQRLSPSILKPVQKTLPALSVLGVTLICASIISTNALALRSIGPGLVLWITAMHAIGGLFGYLVASCMRMRREERRTLCIEVMMQNSSLAVSLAAMHFAGATVPGAVSASLHSVLGSFMAGWWRFADSRRRKVEQSEERATEFRVVENGSSSDY